MNTVPDMFLQDNLGYFDTEEVFQQLRDDKNSTMALKRSYSDAEFDYVPNNAKRTCDEDTFSISSVESEVLEYVAYNPAVATGQNICCASRPNVDLLFSLFEVLESDPEYSYALKQTGSEISLTSSLCDTGFACDFYTGVEVLDYQCESDSMPYMFLEPIYNQRISVL